MDPTGTFRPFYLHLKFPFNGNQTNSHSATWYNEMDELTTVETMRFIAQNKDRNHFIFLLFRLKSLIKRVAKEIVVKSPLHYNLKFWCVSHDVHWVNNTVYVPFLDLFRNQTRHTNTIYSSYLWTKIYLKHCHDPVLEILREGMKKVFHMHQKLSYWGVILGKNIYLWCIITIWF